MEESSSVPPHSDRDLPRLRITRRVLLGGKSITTDGGTTAAASVKDEQDPAALSVLPVVVVVVPVIQDAGLCDYSDQDCRFRSVDEDVDLD